MIRLSGLDERNVKTELWLDYQGTANERGSNRYVHPTTTASHSDSTIFDRSSRFRLTDNVALRSESGRWLPREEHSPPRHRRTNCRNYVAASFVIWNAVPATKRNPRRRYRIGHAVVDHIPSPASGSPALVVQTRAGARRPQRDGWVFVHHLLRFLLFTSQLRDNGTANRSPPATDHKRAHHLKCSLA